MSTQPLHVRHVYSHEAKGFENELNVALREVTTAGGEVLEIQYAMDPATADNRRGGFGALVVFTTGRSPDEDAEAYG